MRQHDLGHTVCWCGKRKPTPEERAGPLGLPCIIKHKYTEAEAMVAADRMRSRKRVRDSHSIEHYRCPHCLAWHVGHHR